MKRVMLGIFGVGVASLLFAGVQSDLTMLRRSEVAKNAELSKLRATLDALDVEAADRITKRLEVQQHELDQLGKRLVSVRTEIGAAEARLEERTRQAAKQAIDAIGSTHVLTKTVESAQRLVDERTRHVADLADRLEERIRDQRTRFDQLRTQLTRDPRSMTSEMLVPTVQLSGDETVGSGTLIASVPARDGKGYETWLLTANHVVRNILADNPTLERKGIAVTLYTTSGQQQHVCDVVLRDPPHDLALARLRTRDAIATTARLVPPERADKLSLWNPVYAVGCPLGNDPIPTGGFIASLENVVRGTKYWMINAPTYYGNSGGGIFDADTRELIAVFSKIYTHGSSRPVVIPHMGLAVPMTIVYPWLEKEGYGFLVPKVESAAAAAAPAK